MSEHACACGLTEALLQNQRGGEMFVCTHTSRGCNAELAAKLERYVKFLHVLPLIFPSV